jgi:hypothetical protein
MFNAALTIAHIGASSSTQPSWPWAWWYLLIIPFIVAPPIAFLSSILQMGRELERAEAYERETLVLLSPPPPGSGA